MRQLRQRIERLLDEARRGDPDYPPTLYVTELVAPGVVNTMPHKTLDPIPVACAIVSQLQTLISRGVDPLDSAVMTIGNVGGRNFFFE